MEEYSSYYNFPDPRLLDEETAKKKLLFALSLEGKDNFLFPYEGKIEKNDLRFQDLEGEYVFHEIKGPVIVIDKQKILWSRRPWVVEKKGEYRVYTATDSRKVNRFLGGAKPYMVFVSYDVSHFY